LKTIVNERLGKRGGGGGSSGGSGGSDGKDAIELTDSNFQVDKLKFIEDILFFNI